MSHGRATPCPTSPSNWTNWLDAVQRCWESKAASSAAQRAKINNVSRRLHARPRVVNIAFLFVSRCSYVTFCCVVWSTMRLRRRILYYSSSSLWHILSVWRILLQYFSSAVATTLMALEWHSLDILFSGTRVHTDSALGALAIMRYTNPSFTYLLTC